MTNAEIIMKMVKENNGTITSAEVTKTGLSRWSLKILVDSGKLERSARGVYILPEIWDDEMYNLQVQFKRGIFSGETALFLNDLTDRTPNRYQMTFPIGYNVTSLKNKNIKAIRTKEEFYELGVIRLLIPGSKPIRVYNREKTLCDILRGRSNADIYIVSEAFKQYAKSTDKNIQLLSEYAKIIRVEKRLRSYLKVLIWEMLCRLLWGKLYKQLLKIETQQI